MNTDDVHLHSASLCISFRSLYVFPFRSLYVFPFRSLLYFHSAAQRRNLLFIRAHPCQSAVESVFTGANRCYASSTRYNRAFASSTSFTASSTVAPTAERCPIFRPLRGLCFS